MCDQRYDFPALGNINITSTATPTAAPSVSSSAGTRNRQRSSKIWEYTSGSSNDSFRNDAGKAVWRCKFCQKEYLESSGTKVAVTHLVTHGITFNSGQELRTISRQASISDAFQRIGAASDYNRRNLSATHTSTLDGHFLRFCIFAGSRLAVSLSAWLKSRNSEHYCYI